ncbi:MAG: histidine kinase [Bacteroidia bacterium]|nr:histidine kinase [Bacteroidia bacterium]
MVQTEEQLISTDSERALLLYMIGVILLVAGLIIAFFIIFQRRKNSILIEKMREKQKFEEELTNSRLEIQEQTLKNIGQELHDNVGQLLSYANMQLNLLSSLVKDGIKSKVDDTQAVIGDTISEVRALSKSLNQDVIASFGLIESIRNEMARINKLGQIEAEFMLMNDEVAFNNPNDEIILFRIVQEFISNTIKYSEATNLDINMTHYPEYILIRLSDNGVGFDESDIEPGSGLINMKSRAKLINTDFEFTSRPGEGVSLKLFYPVA